MKPKGKLFALFAIFAAIGLVTATGAFTSVQATRTADVSVTGDNGALLALQANSTSSVDGVVSTSSGAVTLNFNDGDGSASGINPDATTTFDKVLDVTNNGNQQTSLGVNLNDTASGESGSTETASNFVDVKAINASTGNVIESNLESNSVTLDSGEKVIITFTFDTTVGEVKGDDILDEVTFVAN